MHAPAFRQLRHGALRYATALGCAALFGAVTFVASASTNTSKEHQLKAAFLYNFTRFVEWPDVAAKADQPFVIGLRADQAFADELIKVIGDRKVHGRRVSVRLLTASAELDDVHIVFVDVHGAQQPGEALAQLHTPGVLTVGESDRFCAAGGVITFTREGDKLRFIINVKAADRAGLKISAQLLKLASQIKR